jgi:purine nucleosidase
MDKTPVKLHLDTDLGGDIDDLCALAMLLRWKGLQIVGITTTAEESGRRAGYARYVLNLAGQEEIPVAAGADVALGRFRFHPTYPKEEDFWPAGIIPPASGSLDDALALLKHSIDNGAVVVEIGPFTNLMLLERRYPGILLRARLYLMGGFVFPPRPGFPTWGNEMDYNIQLDPEAAQLVLQHSQPILIPLSVTVETALRRAYLPDLMNSGAVEQLIARQAEAFARLYNNEAVYGATCSGLPEDIINFQHDPLACAVALGWSEGINISNINLRFEILDGLLVEKIDETGKSTKVVTQVNGPAFNESWFRMLTT